MGGTFVRPAEQIGQKLKQIKALVFDWDGVFNTGQKGGHLHSPFSEADSMGTNLLRYGLWLNTGQMPLTAIITGAHNESAFDFAHRERFSAVFHRILDKKEALQEFCRQQQITPEEVAYFFDDANDLAVAQVVGLRILIRRNASPAFRHFVQQAQLCDYITALEGGAHALREAAEMMLWASGLDQAVFRSRMLLDEPYRTYFQARQAMVTKFFSRSELDFIEFLPNPQ